MKRLFVWLVMVVVIIAGLSCKKVAGKDVEPEGPTLLDTFSITSFVPTVISISPQEGKYAVMHYSLDYFHRYSKEYKISFVIFLVQGGKETKVAEGSGIFGGSQGGEESAETVLGTRDGVTYPQYFFITQMVETIKWKIVITLPEGFSEPRVQEKESQNFILENPSLGGSGGDR